MLKDSTIRSTSVDDQFYEYFYEEELKKYLAPRYKNRSAVEIDKHVLDKALDKWKNDIELSLHKINDTFQLKQLSNKWVIMQCYKYIRHVSDVHFKCESNKATLHNLSYIKQYILRICSEQTYTILNYANYYGSVQQKADINKKEVLKVFVSVDASVWFINTIKSKFDIESDKRRGFNAYIKAIFDNSKAKKYVFKVNCSQKNLVDFLNSYYGKTVIKNSSNLSNPSKYHKEVDILLNQFLGKL